MFLEEPNERLVKSPRVNSRGEAWRAFEATMLAKHSKAQLKIKKEADKRQAAFNEMIDSNTRRLWMFVHNTRWRRNEVQLEQLFDGKLVWMLLSDVYACSTKYKVHPDYEFYRVRQAEIIANPMVYATTLRDQSWLFGEGFYRFEMTAEEAAEADRLEAEEMEQYHRDREQIWRDSQHAEYLRGHDKVNDYIRNFIAIPQNQLIQVLQTADAMYRLLYLVSQYPKVNYLMTDILLATIESVDRDMVKRRGMDLIAKLFGYRDFESSKHLIVNDELANLKYQE